MAKKGFPPIYRMARCRKCPRYGRPCLTVEEANIILDDEARRSYNGDAICDECCIKARASANNWTFKKAGRDYADYLIEKYQPEKAAAMNREEALARLAELQAQLEALDNG